LDREEELAGPGFLDWGIAREFGVMSYAGRVHLLHATDRRCFAYPNQDPTRSLSDGLQGPDQFPVLGQFDDQLHEWFV
jgi:hypothetical protein